MEWSGVLDFKSTVQIELMETGSQKHPIESRKEIMESSVMNNLD